MTSAKNGLEKVRDRHWFYLFLLPFLAVSLCHAAEEDVLVREAALVQEGKTSIPSLLAQYREMIRTEPQNPLGYVRAAALYDRDESKGLYEKALSVSSNYAPARVGLARFLARRGEMEAAWTEFQKAIALLPDDESLRLEAVRAAVKTSHLEEAKKLAGENRDLKVEMVQALLDGSKFEEARKALSELGLDLEKSGPVLAAKGRLTYLAAQKENKAEQRRQGVDMLVEAWQKAPELTLHYRWSYPRDSLIQVLTKSGRQKETRPIIEKGIEVFPREYPLYEALWKSWFAEPKADYGAERKAVRAQVETLLNSRPASPDLLRIAALGYEMAGVPAEAEKVNQRLLSEFPYSSPSQSQRRIQAMRAKDLREKAALYEKYNRDFVTMPAYNEHFATLDEMNVPDAELVKAAENYIQNYPYTYLAVLDIGQVFLRRGIYLDRLEQWLDQANKEKNPQEKLNSWDGRLSAVRGKLLLLQGHKEKAEQVLRRVLNMEAQGWSNVDNGRVKFHLAEVLESQGEKDEALDMYAQAYAESQHYIAESGNKFKKLYKQLKGNESGMDDFLSIREGMFQIAANTGIERGTKLNEPAPKFDLLNVRGGRVTLDSLRGKVVVVNFWATWCGPCIKELPHFQEFYEKTKEDAGVAVLAITTDENRGLVGPFILKNKYTFPVLFDEGIRGKFGVRGIPATFIIDRSGMIRLRMIGFNQNEPLVPYLTKLVEQYRTKKAGSGE